MGLSELRVESVVSQVTRELRQAIVSGRLAPGETFSLRKLSADLGVSFIPVREALAVLESEGLVVSARGRSSMVAPLDMDDLAGIYRMRHLIEPELAARSCTLLTRADIARARALLPTIGDPELSMQEIYDAHRDFHLALLLPAANSWEMRVVTLLANASERYVRIGFGRLDADPSEHARRGHAHTSLLDVVASGDVEATRAAVHEHLDRNLEIARHALAEDPDAAAGSPPIGDGVTAHGRQRDSLRPAQP